MATKIRKEKYTFTDLKISKHRM